ncbi:MAG: efflux RND transporter periplasmic adaptor subunit [Pseudomonadota bacterium]
MFVIVRRLFGASLALLALSGCQEQEAPGHEAPRPVKLVTLDDGDASRVRHFPARVEAATRSNLSFRMSGELLELDVEAGQRVEAGEVIARIDDRTARSRLESARSSLELAEATYERMRYTAERGAISQARFDEAKTERQTARSQFEQAEEDFEHTRLRAPYDGVIARVPVDSRQFVQVQETVAVIQQPGQLDVVFHLPEQIVRRLEVPNAGDGTNGSPFFGEMAHEVRFSRDGDPYLARLKSYTTQASNNTLAYEITLTLPQPNDILLLDGMSATVRLDLNSWMDDGESTVWRVPAEAVSYPEASPDQARVWRFSPPDRVDPVPVKVGTLTSQGLEISGELAPGERIVAAGAHRLHDDLAVTPWEKEPGL